MFLTLVPWSKLRFSASLGTIAMRSQQKVDERLWCTGRVTHCETHAKCKWNLLQRRFPMSPLPKHDMHFCVNLCVFHHLDVFFQHVPPNLDVAPHLQSSIVMIVIIVIIIIMCNYMFKTFSAYSVTLTLHHICLYRKNQSLVPYMEHFGASRSVFQLQFHNSPLPRWTWFRFLIHCQLIGPDGSWDMKTPSETLLGHQSCWSCYHVEN